VLDNNGVLYVGSQDGYLYAIQTESDSLASIPWPKQGCNIFNTNRVLYPAPSLFFPSDSATAMDTSLELSWHKVQGAKQFVVEFASNSNFTNSITREITDTSTIFHGLQHGQIYYWRVRTDFGIKLSNWSPVRNFKTTNVTGIEDLAESAYWLKQNYPNPFDYSTIIEFRIPKTDHILLVLTDMSGKEIVLFDGVLSEGTYQFKVLKNNLHSGVWLYSIRTNEYLEAKKMIIE
jgi:hypothetical protein